MDILHTPAGVRDLLFEDSKRKNEILKGMWEVIEDYGFSLINTPAFEYMDCYSRDIGTIPINELYKFTDNDGNLLALRPDFTPSIARVSAKYFKDSGKPIKLGYYGSVFKNRKIYQGRLHESTQLGAEHIGATGLSADSELIKMAIDCLLRANLKDFNVSVGHVDIFYGFCEACNFSEQEILTAKVFVRNKNTLALEDMLTAKGVENKLKTAFLSCIGIVTSESALKELIELTKSIPKVNNALIYLCDLMNIITKDGNGDNVCLDLSHVNDYGYYTGIIFCGYTFGSGNAILTGGRYDKLLGQFGKDAPAIGFAVLIDDICDAGIRQAQDPQLLENKERYITVALGKGRLAKKASELFSKLGIDASKVQDKETRKLIFTDEENKIRFFLAKVPDVPTYVEYGVADIGIVGEDTILEEGKNIYEVLDLKFGKCKMCVCGYPKAKELLGGPKILRVATKYPNIALNYFKNTLNQSVEIVKLNGSIELAPILELTDVIVDIVETGSTLRENGLVVLDEVCDLSARVVVNPVTMQMENERIQKLIRGLKGVTNES